MWRGYRPVLVRQAHWVVYVSELFSFFSKPVNSRFRFVLTACIGRSKGDLLSEFTERLANLFEDSKGMVIFFG